MGNGDEAKNSALSACPPSFGGKHFSVTHGRGRRVALELLRGIRIRTTRCTSLGHVSTQRCKEVIWKMFVGFHDY